MSPLPLVRLATGVPPAVSVSATLESATRTSGAPAASVVFSNARSPIRLWPPTVMPAPSASTRRYGTVCVVSTAMSIACRLSSVIGSWSTSACRRPAMPAAEIVKSPAPFLRLRIVVAPAASVSVTLSAVMWVTAPRRSKEKLPESC